MRPALTAALSAVLIASLMATALAAQQVTTLAVQVNEVHITFHAFDAEGRFIPDVQANDLELRDNGRPPARIVSLLPRTALPMRVGILIDTSRSMLGTANFRTRRISTLLASQILNPATDQAFVERFDSDAKLLQPMTADITAIALAAIHAADDAGSRIGGTQLFNTLYRACRDSFPSGGTNNAVLLFSDGNDNASNARLSDVIDICQQKHAAVYVFSAASGNHSEGQHNLAEIAAQSGGRVFYNNFDFEPYFVQQFRNPGSRIPDDPAWLRDLNVFAREMRNEYDLVYKPAQLKPDGKFHKIKIGTPYRPIAITARSGYYAPH